MLSSASPTGRGAARRRREEVPTDVTIDRDELARAMEALRADPTAVLEFVLTYGDQLRTVARSHLFELGRADLARDTDEVEGLAWEIGFLLADHASGWQPGGALPWSWAYRAVRSLVARTIGHARADVELDAVLAGDEAGMSGVGGTGEVDEDLDLGALARMHPVLALLCEALDEHVVSERHRRVHLEYRIQKALGDPSPASTVGAMFGLGAANVRQIDRRVRLCLHRAVDADGRYRELRELPWLAEPTVVAA